MSRPAAQTPAPGDDASPTTTARELAPAKLNLGLRVRGRRPDGLHELRSLVVPLAWGDEIRVTLAPRPRPDGGVPGVAPGEPRPDGPRLDPPRPDPPDPDLSRLDPPEVTCRCPAVPALDGPDNLAARAATALLARTPGRWRCHIRIHKRIPVAAGLGGGSADAAATLRALSRLLRPGLSPDRLHDLAATLGADVPVCLLRRPARVAGWGQRVAPIDPLPGFSLCLVHPPLAISTREIFDALRAPPVDVAPTARPAEASESSESPAPPTSLRALCAEVVNDLWPTVRARYPALDDPWDALAALGPLAQGISGSGPTLFGIFADRPAAERAAAALGRAGWSARATVPLISGATARDQ